MTPVELVSRSTTSAAPQFDSWVRSHRAARDGPGLLFALVFHTVAIYQHATVMPPHVFVHYCATVAALAALLAWQRSGAASYVAARNWVAALIRLHTFLMPWHLWVWYHALEQHAPPPQTLLPALASLLANTTAVQLFLLPIAHTLPLGAGLLVQLVSTGAMVGRVRSAMCASPAFSHPLAQSVLGQLHWWSSWAFSPLAVAGIAPPAAASGPKQQCWQVLASVLVLSGLVLQPVQQAVQERRLWWAFCAEQRQQGGQQRRFQAAGMDNQQQPGACALERAQWRAESHARRLLEVLGSDWTRLWLAAAVVWGAIDLLIPLV